ncbi:hypothetical protein Csa_023508, partial [Cucumis sativus]
GEKPKDNHGERHIIYFESEGKISRKQRKGRRENYYCNILISQQPILCVRSSSFCKFLFRSATYGVFHTARLLLLRFRLQNHPNFLFLTLHCTPRCLQQDDIDLQLVFASMGFRRLCDSRGLEHFSLNSRLRFR